MYIPFASVLCYPVHEKLQSAKGEFPSNASLLALGGGPHLACGLRPAPKAPAQNQRPPLSTGGQI